MPVFDQGYQHWKGKPTSQTWRWLVIARQGIRSQLKNRRVKYPVVAAWTPALGLAALLALWGLFEQKADILKPYLDILRSILPLDIFEDPRIFRTSVWTILFDAFLGIETFIALVLVLLIGPDLISQDLRYNAIPLYLSRPILRFHYFLGKLGIIVGFLAMVTMVPVLMAYVIGVAFSLDWTVVRDTWHVLAGSLAYGLIVALVCGLIMLAFSSLSRNSRGVAMLWVALWMITTVVAVDMVNSTMDRAHPGNRDHERWWAISYKANLDRARAAALNTPAAYEQVVKAAQRAREFARGLSGGSGFGPLAPRPPEPVADSSIDPAETSGLLASFLWPPFPLSWAVAILGGLSLLSILILSNRIKSLDRLR